MIEETVDNTIQSRESTHGSWSEGAAISQQLKKILREYSESRSDSINEALDRPVKNAIGTSF